MELLLAPMDGMSSAAFRSVCFEYGADGASTEMISAMCYARARRRISAFEERISRLPQEKRLAGQLIGRDPEQMAVSAARLTALERFELIEVNMGCPARTVVGSGSGAALLLEPETAEKILRAVCAATVLPVRLKFRLGWDARHINAREIALRAQDAGVRELTLHARTREQFYNGEADAAALRAVCECVSIPVYANGGVRRAEDAADFLEKSGAAGLCIGRAALRAPWIFEDIRALERGEICPERDARERVGLLIRLVERLCAIKPERYAVCEMRKFCEWYLTGLSGAEAEVSAINRIESRAALEDRLERYLEALERAGDTGLHREREFAPTLDTVARKYRVYRSL